MNDLPIIIQPALQMSVDTAAKIASGRAYIIGGVVREVGTGRLVELLSDAPELGRAGQEVVQRMAKSGLSKFEIPKVDSKVALATGGVLLVTGVAVGGYRWATSRRKTALSTKSLGRTADETALDDGVDPACLIAFRAALKAYVDAGSSGCLTPVIIDALVKQLDAVQDYADDGNAIVFSLEELLPFFELVTAHTPVLAAAFDVELTDVEVADTDVVVSLRKHLETQKEILGSAA